MVDLLRHRLLWRFVALGVLTLCFVILSRNSDYGSLARTRVLNPAPKVAQAPIITAPAQPGTPLAISRLRIISWNGHNLEVALDLINLSSKSIRAYAVKQRLLREERSKAVTFTSLDLTNRLPLSPDQSTTDFEVVQVTTAQEDQIVFSVDYVEFSDGTKWGADSANFADHSAGQRAAAHILSKRLLRILEEGNSSDVMAAIESGVESIEPPANRSAEWKAGFRGGSNSMAGHLKRAQKNGSLSQVERELRKLAKRFERQN